MWKELNQTVHNSCLITVKIIIHNCDKIYECKKTNISRSSISDMKIGNLILYFYIVDLYRYYANLIKFKYVNIKMWTGRFNIIARKHLSLFQWIWVILHTYWKASRLWQHPIWSDWAGRTSGKDGRKARVKNVHRHSLPVRMRWKPIGHNCQGCSEQCHDARRQVPRRLAAVGGSRDAYVAACASWGSGLCVACHVDSSRPVTSNLQLIIGGG